MILTTETCKKILNSYSKGASFKCSELTRFNNILGFMGEHYKLQITYTTKENDECISFFVKTVPLSTAKHMEYIQQIGIFEKEALFYENLLPRLQSYFKEKFAPANYLSNPDVFIVLEDLNRIGYENFKADLTMEHCLSVMETMARFHAASIVFEEKHSKDNRAYRLCDHFKEELVEAYYVVKPGHPRQIIFGNTLKAIMDLIDLVSPDKSEIVNRNIEEFVKMDYGKRVKPSNTFRNTVTHCDLWRNNILFRQSNGAMECVLVDFQFVRYSPPALDVLLTLYLNCSSKFLREQMNSLLEYYYKCFYHNLTLHHIDPSKIMDWDGFCNSQATYKPVALLDAVFFATIIYIDDDLANGMLRDNKIFEEYFCTNRSKYAIEQFKRNETFKSRVADMLTPLIEHFNSA